MVLSLDSEMATVRWHYGLEDSNLSQRKTVSSIFTLHKGQRKTVSSIFTLHKGGVEAAYH